MENFWPPPPGKKTHFWNAVGQLVSTTPDHGGTIADLRWHPQKEELAVAAYGGVSVWDANDFTTMTPLPYKGPLLAIGWSPDGQWLVSGNQDASLHIWPMRKKTEDLHMSGYAVKVRHLSWSRDSRRMACANLNHITVWDFSGKGPANTTPEMFETLSGEVTALAYHPAEPLLIAVGDTDGFVALYSHSIKNFVALRALDNEPVERLIWNHSGSQLAVAGRNGLVRVWKINLGK
ncbi:hypothetical protein QPK87_24145 [Kamptonema cortianum]|nr:hypothetical protein [Kamptonema cortianum]